MNIALVTLFYPYSSTIPNTTCVVYLVVDTLVKLEP